MPPLVFDYRDADPVRSNLAKINHKRKSWHERAPDVSRKYHPTCWCGRDPKNKSLELVNEFPSKTGDPGIVKVADIFKFLPDGGMVLNSHRRSRAIISSWETGWTCPFCNWLSRSSASANAASSPGPDGILKGSSKLSHSDSASSALFSGGRRNASAASCSMLMHPYSTRNTGAGKHFCRRQSVDFPPYFYSLRSTKR